LDLPTKIQKLRGFIEPVAGQWQRPELKNSVSSYAAFCHLLGLDKAQRYLVSRRAHQMNDWGECKLDEEGLALQAELDDRLKPLPLRPTKSFLTYSVERVDKAAPAFQASYALWQDSVAQILPDLLQFLR
jgi:exportin-5